jgi:hypothetical protein
MLTSLRDSLQNLEEPQAGAIASTTRNSCHPHHTPEEKVELFRNLFRGRDDIYPLMWVNCTPSAPVGQNSLIV